MPSPHSTPPASSEHADGAAAWGLLIGTLVGAGVGAFLGHWLAGSVGVAAIGWIAGAFVDRSRR